MDITFSTTFLLVPPGTDPVTLTHTPSQQGNGVHIHVVEVDNATSAAASGVAVDVGNSPALSPTITTTAADSVAMYAATVSSDTTATITDASGLYTKATINGGLDSGAAAWERIASASSDSATFTWGGNIAGAALAIELLK